MIANYSFIALLLFENIKMTIGEFVKSWPLSLSICLLFQADGNSLLTGCGR